MRVARLAGLTTLISSGATPLGGSANYSSSGEVMLVRSQNVLMGRLSLDEVAFVDREAANRMSRTYLSRGDVLLNITGASIGRVASFELDVTANVNQHVCVIRPKPDVLDYRFLSSFLASPVMQRHIDGNQHGGTRQALTFAQIGEFEIPLPPLPEQRRIADILDKADAIRRKRKEAIALTEELLRSAFLEMFGDPVTNPKGWPVKPLGELLAFLTSGSRGWAQHYADNGETFLRIQNVRRDSLDLSDVAFVQTPDSAEARRTETKPGDVLLSITADLGRTAVIPATLPRAFINQHLAILRPQGVNAEYLSAFLASEGGQLQINRRNKGGVKAGLNFDDVRSVEVPLPPVAAQENFAGAKSRIRATSADMKRALTLDDDLFRSLVARAFSGALESP